MDTMEALLTRRSIRKYRPEPVSIEDLKEILAAGATAPSAVNMQHWYFVAGMPLILVCQAALAIYLVALVEIDETR